MVYIQEMSLENSHLSSLQFFSVFFFIICFQVMGYSQVALVVRNPPAVAGDIRNVVQFPGREDPLEKGMATHSSILAWRKPWTKDPGRLQSTGSQKVRHY